MAFVGPSEGSMLGGQLFTVLGIGFGAGYACNFRAGSGNAVETPLTLVADDAHGVPSGECSIPPWPWAADALSVEPITLEVLRPAAHLGFPTRVVAWTPAPFVRSYSAGNSGGTLCTVHLQPKSSHPHPTP